MFYRPGQRKKLGRGQDTEQGTEEHEGAKWSGARTLGQEGNDHPQRGFRACTISTPSPQKKTKEHFRWLASGFSLHGLSLCSKSAPL